MTEVAARFEGSALDRCFRYQRVNPSPRALRDADDNVGVRGGRTFTLYFLIPLLQDNLSWI